MAASPELSRIGARLSCIAVYYLQDQRKLCMSRGVKNLMKDYRRPCKQHISKQVFDILVAFWLHYSIQRTYWNCERTQ